MTRNISPARGGVEQIAEAQISPPRARVRHSLFPSVHRETARLLASFLSQVEFEIGFGVGSPLQYLAGRGRHCTPLDLTPSLSFYLSSRAAAFGRSVAWSVLRFEVAWIGSWNGGVSTQAKPHLERRLLCLFVRVDWREWTHLRRNGRMME